MPFTLVAFHAHPDDESLLMGGTIARAAAEGHRVVLVTATDGAAGLAGSTAGTGAALGALRLQELERAAEALGVARVVHLGYPDGAFAASGTSTPAEALVQVIESEAADVLTGYDPAGGYGHPDHVHVHRVAREAARRTPGVSLLEVTVDRTLVVRGASLLRLVPGAPAVDMERMRQSYLPRAELTHKVDISTFLDAKLNGLAAHASQQSGGRGFRTVTMLRRLPGPIGRVVLGHEWFREVGRAPGTGLTDDIFASCR